MGEDMNRNAAIASVLVVVHAIIAFVHGQAHERLEVGLAPWQWAYVYIVITAAPVLAAVLFWTPLRAAGAALLALSMLGSFLFGVYYHFVEVSPDNVGHLPAGDAQGLFVATAVLLAISEAAASAFGFWCWAKSRRGEKQTGANLP